MPTVTQDLNNLPDVQSELDGRGMPIQRVGVTDVRYPICFSSSESTQSTSGLWEVAVSLVREKRGTHMSRFLEVLSEFEGVQTLDTLFEMCVQVKERVSAEDAFLKVQFPWFVEKTAPVSKRIGKLGFDAEISVSCGRACGTEVSIRVPATSLCPCSKQVSDFGAHNQRCELRLSVRFSDGEMISLEEMFRIAERSASAQLYSVIKRVDEKHVTEQAYSNPKFVEDTVRDLAESLNSDVRIEWFKCSVENFESIHSHNAFAEIISE